MEKEDISRAAILFKALADENRAKTVYALCQEKELCVCDVANIINSTVATASHHLRALRKQGIVKFRKDGKLAFYSLVDGHLQQLMEVALAHKNEVNIND
jgi:DNA-binding transcriptional ArsR family regulator